MGFLQHGSKRLYDENRSVVSRQSSDKDKRRRGARVLHALAARCSLLTLAAVLAAAAPAWAQTDWIIETVAGNADVADGGPATAAQLSSPIGVAVDSDDNIYIADTNNHRIRKVDGDGNISTVAGDGTPGDGGDGGPATSAQLNAPRGVAVDGDGNIYIADVNNQLVRKVTASTGVITTVAGNGTKGRDGDDGPATAAQLNSPWDVALDSARNIYIADRLNFRIRKVTVSTGNITTVAGTGPGSYGGDGGQATATVLGGSLSGVAVDSDRNIYIAVQQNRILKVTAAGMDAGKISTVAGTGVAGYTGDGGAATAATLRFPFGVAVDGSNNIYITDTINNRIRKVDTAGNISTVAGSTVMGSGVTPGDGGDGGSATAAAVKMYYPQGSVAVDSSGNLYITDTLNGRVRKVDTSGNISTFAGRLKSDPSGDGGAATAAQLNIPYGVAVDSSGNLYLSDAGNNRVRKVDATTGVITTVAGSGAHGFSGDTGPATSAQLRTPYGLAVDSDNNLYIADGRNNRIRKVTASTGFISTVAGTTQGFGGDNGPATATAAKLNGPRGVAVDGSGNIYIADTSNHRIRKLTATTTGFDISTVAGTGTKGLSGDGGAATSATLDLPYGVAVDGSGNIYIAGIDNHRIRKVDTSATPWTISRVAGTEAKISGYYGDGGAATAAWLNGPVGVAVDGSGNIYIADRNNERIRKVDATTGEISTVAGTGTPGYNGDGCRATTAQLSSPYGVAVDASGNVYIADGANNRIRKIGPAPAGSAPGPCGVADSVPGPVAPPREPEPTVKPVGVSELTFAPAAGADPSAPMSQPLTLRAEGEAAEFEVLTSARWIEVSRSSGSASWKGRLAAGETVTLRVTVNPLGLRPGTHRGYVYIRSGGSVSRVRIVLEVAPPTGPDVTESGGVLNAARMSAYGEAGLFGPPALPLTPGSLVVVQGVNFLAGERLEAADFPLPTSLEGVRVLFDGLEAPLFAVEPQRIEAQLPRALGREALEAGGATVAEVVVEAGGKSSYPRRFWVGSHGPGVFTASGAGSGQAIVLFAGTTALAAPRGAGEGSRPAQAGDVLEIYATGLGPVEPPVADGENSCAPAGICLADGSNVVLRHTTERPRVSIGGVAVAADGVLFSGLAPTLAAVDMVVVEVPAGIAPSAAAEVIVAIGGGSSQSGVTIAVE